MDEVMGENPEESERLIDVGGHHLLLRCAGEGWPPVVLEAGLGDTTTSPEWAPMRRGIATFT